jgi:hypothetical protein
MQWSMSLNNDATSSQKQMEYSYVTEIYNRLDEFMKPFITKQINVKFILHNSITAELVLLPTVVAYSSSG